MIRKFSLDPKRLSMKPDSGIAPRQNDAKWLEFHMEDEEMMSLVNDTMHLYSQRLIPG
jgi:hypothetical protein